MKRERERKGGQRGKETRTSSFKTQLAVEKDVKRVKDVRRHVFSSDTSRRSGSSLLLSRSRIGSEVGGVCDRGTKQREKGRGSSVRCFYTSLRYQGSSLPARTSSRKRRELKGGKERGEGGKRRGKLKAHRWTFRFPRESPCKDTWR